MYRISSTNAWHHGRQFDSFAEAKSYADKHSRNGDTLDVIALTDRDNFRVACTGKGSNAGPAIRGTYRK